MKMLQYFHVYADTRPPEPVSPCIPSPCGSNAVCREQNGAGSCTCLPEYFGNPYEACQPECIVNSDCASNKACVNNKCKDPCPGTCGPNAECQTVAHTPSCSCLPSYTGDPFRYCSLIIIQPGKKVSSRNDDSLNKVQDIYSSCFVRCTSTAEQSMRAVTVWS